MACINGGLYARSKSLIPFLPLLCYLTAVYLEKLKRRDIPLPVYIAAHALTMALLCYCHYCKGELAGHTQEWHLLLADGGIMFVCFLLFWKSGHISLLMLPPVVFLLIFGSAAGRTGLLLSQKSYDALTDKKIGRLIHQTLSDEPELCRMEQRGEDGGISSDLNRIWDTRQWISSLYSSIYHSGLRSFCQTGFCIEEPFRNSLMQSVSDNPLYQKLMGVKYIVRKKPVSKNTASHTEKAGYRPYRSSKTLTVYQNDHTAPIAYATSRLISEKDYLRLKFPYNQIALMKYAVVGDAPALNRADLADITDSAKPVSLQFHEMDTPDLTIKASSEGTYHIRAGKQAACACRIEQTVSGENALLYLQFHVKNNRPSQDVSIQVDHIRNRLSASGHLYYNGNTTFTYVTVLNDKEQDVELIWGKGDYEISDIQCYLGSTAVLRDKADPCQKLYQSKFRPCRTQTKGSSIQGKILVKKDGYFITSIPYEPGFEIYVDGEKVTAERVNTAFLGFPVKKGNRNVKIVYHAPGAKAGKIVSCTGLLLFLIALYIQNHRRPRYYPNAF